MTPSPDDVTIATAGHVDHGKSALVRALTGTDPDRLPEERRRSMTIELGFAAFPRPSGGTVALIDVPGHERLVETMIGGSGGIDAALLVVAADDGPMPQTREHLRILDQLGIRRIVVALTKSDLHDEEWLTLIAAETASLLSDRGFRDIPIVAVSSRTGFGIESLRARLLTVAPKSRPSVPDEAAWLPIDRVFSQPGVGTVIAGTLVSGRLAAGNSVVVQPSGIQTTIRQLRSQGHVVSAVVPGQRVAVNLAGVDRSAISHGDVLSDRPITLSSFADVQLRVEDGAATSISSGDTVRVLTGTARRNARIRLLGSNRLLPGQEGIAEIAFDQPVPLRFDDRMIVRRASPPATLGGGVVLVRHATRPRGSRRAHWPVLRALAGGDPFLELRRRLASGPIAMSALTADLPGEPGPVTRAWLADRTILPLDHARKNERLVTPETMVVSRQAWDGFIERLVGELAHFHTTSPQSPGMPLTYLRSSLDRRAAHHTGMIEAAIRRGLVVQSGPSVHLPGHRPRLSPASRRLADIWLDGIASQPLGRATRSAGLDDDELAILERDGELVGLGDRRFVTTAAFDRFGVAVLVRIQGGGAVDLVSIRDAHALGRDAAQRLLERLDDLGVTTRVGVGRIIGPHAPAWRSKAVERTICQSGDATPHDDRSCPVVHASGAARSPAPAPAPIADAASSVVMGDDP